MEPLILVRDFVLVRVLWRRGCRPLSAGRHSARLAAARPQVTFGPDVTEVGTCPASPAFHFTSFSAWQSRDITK
ncbi:hypothetical protein Zmor_021074 [Zophobas morio]|uniref:Uncharacterized protein n=1 Tax=Zophobas morio TaxID=2755281 RepID=A0AA38I4I7_9CUCU|nr:hypothetical protein Zmor_021074 [Zophobas morio]